MKLEARLWNLVQNMRLQIAGLKKDCHSAGTSLPALVSVFSVVVLVAVNQMSAQTAFPDSPSTVLIAQQSQLVTSQSGDHAQSDASSGHINTPQAVPDPERKIQTKRILGIIPNYRSVSADTDLPPQSFKDKFVLATQDSFDYSSFILAGAIAGVAQAQKSYPEFRQGAAGYGRYYWHAFADQAAGNYFTEAIVPSLTREDSRYYTLGHGNFLRRSSYAVSRLFMTRTDSDGRTFNISEIGGNLAGAAVSDAYYPSRERTWTKTQQKWATQVGLDGVFNMFKEFWPDINRSVFHQKY